MGYIFPQTSSVLIEAIQECCADCDPIQTYLGVKTLWNKAQADQIYLLCSAKELHAKEKEVLILEGPGMIVEQNMFLHSS